MVHLFNEYLHRDYYVPDTFMGPRHRIANKKKSLSWISYLSGGRLTVNKQQSRIYRMLVSWRKTIQVRRTVSVGGRTTISIWVTMEGGVVLSCATWWGYIVSPFPVRSLCSIGREEVKQPSFGFFFVFFCALKVRTDVIILMNAVAYLLAHVINMGSGQACKCFTFPCILLQLLWLLGQICA